MTRISISDLDQEIRNNIHRFIYTSIFFLCKKAMNRDNKCADRLGFALGSALVMNVTWFIALLYVASCIRLIRIVLIVG